jgi:HK97 family phage portal protein
MQILKLFRRKEAPPRGILDLVRLTLYGGAEAESGEFVSPETALRCSAVYSCVGILAESIAQLPLKLYRRTAGGKEEVEGSPLRRILGWKPNEWQTSFEFREMAMQHLCLRGNFYAYKVTDSRDEVRELLPLHPDQVSVEQQSDWSLAYRITFNGGRQETVDRSRIFHVRYRTLDGVRGISPILYHRDTVGLALTTLRHGSRVFRNGALPTGILQHPGKLSKESLERLRESWEASYGGANSGKTAILEEGMTFTGLTMSNEDMQYLETRSFQVEDIARIYRVPLHMIQSTEKSTSWGSGIENMSLGFVQFTLLPWIRRFESAIWRDLIPDREKDSLFPEFLVDGLMRGDIKSRYTAYQLAIQNGIMSPNEVRAKENLNPRLGGDDFLSPLNMRLTGPDGEEKEVEDDDETET